MCTWPYDVAVSGTSHEIGSPPFRYTCSAAPQIIFQDRESPLRWSTSGVADARFTVWVTYSAILYGPNHIFDQRELTRADFGKGGQRANRGALRSACRCAGSLDVKVCCK